MEEKIKIDEKDREVAKLYNMLAHAQVRIGCQETELSMAKVSEEVLSKLSKKTSGALSSKFPGLAIEALVATSAVLAAGEKHRMKKNWPGCASRSAL